MSLVLAKAQDFSYAETYQGMGQGQKWNKLLYHVDIYQGRVKGNRLSTVNKHFGDWLLLHLLMKNIDRRTFQEIVNEICPDDEKSCNKTSPIRRILTNISEDDTGKEENVQNGSQHLEVNEENSDEKDKFFLPGNGRQRRIAVNFEDNLSNV